MKKIDLRWFGECSPCDISAILLRCIGEHQRSFGDAPPRHQWKGGGGIGEEVGEGRGVRPI